MQLPSDAAVAYKLSAQKASLLRDTANRRELAISRSDKQIYYHAALATYVASWEAYVNKVVIGFFDSTSNPFDPKFHALHTIAKSTTERLLKRFNTPNAENTRNLFIQAIGYDPIADWQWPARSMSGLLLRERLNETLKVRHSFAHGFSIPSYSWTCSPSGRIRLTSNAIRNVEDFFAHLVSVTDQGIQSHISHIYA